MAVDVPLFEQVADAVRSLAPEELGVLQTRWHRRGIKVWFGPEKPPRQHYEAQVVPRRHVDGTDGMVIEVGFHAEHRELDRNEAVIAHLAGAEKKWRRRLGSEAELGVFLGAPDWRRLSEVWFEPDLEDPELAFEMALRLVDYVSAIEPVAATAG